MTILYYQRYMSMSVYAVYSLKSSLVASQTWNASPTCSPRSISHHKEISCSRSMQSPSISVKITRNLVIRLVSNWIQLECLKIFESCGLRNPGNFGIDAVTTCQRDYWLGITASWESLGLMLKLSILKTSQFRLRCKKKHQKSQNNMTFTYKYYDWKEVFCTSKTRFWYKPTGADLCPGRTSNTSSKGTRLSAQPTTASVQCWNAATASCSYCVRITHGSLCMCRRGGSTWYSK